MIRTIIEAGQQRNVLEGFLLRNNMHREPGILHQDTLTTQPELALSEPERINQAAADTIIACH